MTSEIEHCALLTLCDGPKIAVPDSIDLITPYVLREQGDYFEDELSFVRVLLHPDDTAIDVGANFGVYALSMAQKVGAGGHVWAFEPGTRTAEFLSHGVRANGFEHVTVVQEAVSNSSGQAQLSVQPSPELNTLIHGHAAECTSEPVTVVTLDTCMDRYGWTDIKLIKIDAEGEESNIVNGGRAFLTRNTPLVQYEIRKASAVNFRLIEQFQALGYESYRLVPGLQLLVPFDQLSDVDPYLLNLFCCKPDRAQQLAAEGFLLMRSDLETSPDSTGLSEAPNQASTRYHWSQTLAHLAYAAPLVPAWQESEGTGSCSEVVRALASYAQSRDCTLSALERFRALSSCFFALKAQCAQDPGQLRLASLARAAHDYGARAEVVASLKRLLVQIRQHGVDMSEPFLPPMERFDAINCGAEPAAWLVAATLEQLEKREYYSTFYAGAAARERLEDIRALGFGSPEMDRRLALVCRRIQEARQGIAS